MRDDEAVLTEAIIRLAKQHGRYGYRRIREMLIAEGWRVSDDVTSLAGRIGVRIARDFAVPALNDGKSGKLTGWVRPSVWYEFLVRPTTAFSSETGSVPFAADLGGRTLEVNAGLTLALDDSIAIYANGSYFVGLGGHADGSAFDGKIGLKYTW